jgi:hypothetical protein
MPGGILPGGMGRGDLAIGPACKSVPTVPTGAVSTGTSSVVFCFFSAGSSGGGKSKRAIAPSFASFFAPTLRPVSMPRAVGSGELAAAGEAVAMVVLTGFAAASPGVDGALGV